MAIRTGYGFNRGDDIQINNRGKIVVTGIFSGTMRIGNVNLKSKGKHDIFLLFFNADGELLMAKGIAVNV